MLKARHERTLLVTFIAGGGGIGDGSVGGCGDGSVGGGTLTSYEEESLHFSLHLTSVESRTSALLFSHTRHSNI